MSKVVVVDIECDECGAAMAPQSFDIKVDQTFKHLFEQMLTAAHWGQVSDKDLCPACVAKFERYSKELRH